jgi:hypothetical protein
MRRTLVSVVALALFAVACGSAASTTDVATEPEAAQDAAAQALATGQAADENPEPETPDAAPAAADAPSCGFGGDVEAESVEIVQIPGDDRETNPSALAGAHPDFPEPLVDPDQIISGGPPPDGIPPIDAPRFQTAASVDWLQCSEPVLSLVVDGDARAYPLQVMTWHEIVNDTFGDLPVTVSFCPLCNSALVYNRDIGDRVLDFGTSGRLFNSSLVMYDRTTESMWTHFNGQAVVGTLTGVQLERLPVQTVSWANFLEAHPDGIVLTRDTGFQRSYGRNPYEGYDTTADDPFLFRGELDGRLAAKQRVVSITDGSDSVAIVLDHLAEQQVLSVDVAGRSLTVWHLPGTSSALETSIIAEGRDVGAVGVFDPVVDGAELTFTRADDGTFTDDVTGSTWTIGGQAIAGDLEGTRLAGVPHIDTFWFAIAAFRPDTEIVSAG